MSDDDLEQRGFFQRHRITIGIFGSLLLAGTYTARQLTTSPCTVPRKVETISVVKLTSIPPLPPPPPRSVVQPPPKQKMVEQMPIDQPEQKPEAAAKPEEPPAGPLGTGITGQGTDGFGLGKSGNGAGGNGTGSGSGHKGSRWGWYAGQVQSRIQEALRNNRKTRDAAMRIEVRIWPDSAGRIARAKLSGTTGDPAIDAALQNEVLTGLRLSEPPPEGMPIPIVMRLTARRPN